jgi:hypothetical protein
MLRVLVPNANFIGGMVADDINRSIYSPLTHRDLGTHRPRVLGSDVEHATAVFLERLQHAHASGSRQANQIVSLIPFIISHPEAKECRHSFARCRPLRAGKSYDLGVSLTAQLLTAVILSTGYTLGIALPSAPCVEDGRKQRGALFESVPQRTGSKKAPAAQGFSCGQFNAVL